VANVAYAVGFDFCHQLKQEANQLHELGVLILDMLDVMYSKGLFTLRPSVAVRLRRP
jgi:hypothetical protein